MRSTLLLSLALLLSTTLTAQNMLSNGSFEQGDANWAISIWGGASMFYSLSDDATEGFSSLRLQVDVPSPEANQFQAGMRQSTIQLEKDTVYSLSFDMKSNSGLVDTIGVLIHSHPNLGGQAWGEAWKDTKITFMGDGEWHSIELEFTATSMAGEPDFEVLNFGLGFGLAANVFFLDNVVLNKASGGGTEPPVDGMRSFYVSKEGDDTNDGTMDAPFLTISKAALLAGPGDSVIISSGIYRETVTPARSGTPIAPILFMAAPGADVTISAMEYLNGWTNAGGSKWTNPSGTNLGDENFILYNDTYCDLARFPNNEDNNPFTLEARDNTGGSPNHLTANIPPYDWADGGHLWFLGKNRWTSWRASITASSTNRVDFVGPDGWVGSAHNPQDQGEYILYGVQNALDYQYEYIFNGNALTLQLAAGESPEDDQVRIRHREKTVNLKNRQFIELRGLTLFGGFLDMSGNSRGNIFIDGNIYWGSNSIAKDSGPFPGKTSVFMQGSDNRIETTEIAYGTGSGVRLEGNGNVVHNCLIHDFNGIASYDAPILARGGENSVITRNTIYNGGRDLIQSVNRNVEIAYNDLYGSNVTNDDCGPIYTCCGEHQSTIHHNFIHDSESRGDKYKAAAVYLDNDTKFWSVHHNVIKNMEWTAFQINWDGWNLDIYNNTVMNVSETIGAWIRSGQDEFRNDRFINNLTDNSEMIRGTSGMEFQNNMVYSSSPFQDAANNNFSLSAGNAAIDAGTTVDGLDIPFEGAAPDVGALESGADVFAPGVTWQENPFSSANPVSNRNVAVVRESIAIAPNPTNDLIRLDGEGLIDGELSIFTVNGKLLKRISNYQIGQSVSVSELPNGVFFLYLRSGNVARSGRFMKF